MSSKKPVAMSMQKLGTKYAGTSLSALALLVLIGGNVSGAQAGPRDDKWTFVLAGIEEHRNRLKSAEYEIDGTKNFSEGSLVPGKFRLVGAFDIQQGRWRQDRDEAAWVVPDAERHAKEVSQRYSGPFDEGRQYHKACLTKDALIVWAVDRSDYIGIERPEKQRIQWSKLIDPRGLGLYHEFHFESGEFPLLKDLIEYFGPLDFRFQTESDHSWVFALEVPNDYSTLKWEITVDMDRGYTIPRFDVTEKWKAKDNGFEPSELVEVHWEKRNEVWLPVYHRLTTVEGKNSRVREMNVLWKTINGDVSDRWFTPEGFDAPDDIGILDNRLGTPVVLKPSRRGRPEAALSPAPSRTGLYALLFFSNVVVFLGIATLLYLKRKKHHSEPLQKSIASTPVRVVQ